MNTAKVRILEDTFNKLFELQQFKRFIKEFFNEPEMFPDSRRTGIWKEYMDHISAYFKIGKYEDSLDNSLIVLAVELKKGKSVERARAMQRSFISKLLDENNFEAAIVAFYAPNESSWRLSFVRLDYTFTDKGLELDLTPVRRYSYLVGEGEPNHTAKAQLLSIIENDKANPTLDEIETAFSVEKVTKHFFEQYKEKYIQLKEYLEADSAFIKESEKLGFQVDKFSEQFAKKLLGQLAFLYFLQKKGWLGVRILPKERVLLESEYQKIYYQQDEIHRKVLENLFEKADVGKRKIIAKQLLELTDHEAALFSDCFVGTEHEQQWGEGNKRFISQLFQTCKKRKTSNNFFNDFLQPLFYEALNRKRKNHYFNLFNCKIPFLNGGLFEPLEGYHWRDVRINIPNELFSNEEEKECEADGILDIFERFNFTMNEDEPLEKEVAVDPEMLGKIFENLLDVKDRKSKGAFYTPREIVHYMCRESLVSYLSNEVGIPYEDIKEFILYGDLIKDVDSRRQVKELSIKPTVYNSIVKIDRALKNVKIADPAVGSGAFPLGMLSELVRARNNITDYLVKTDIAGGFGRKIGEEHIRKIRSPFRLKWESIKNSIFAVDIEPSAVDISKLRLWLSVVVDQEINEETPEPHPLPNLDMNIMVGNSLIDEYEGIKLFDESILKKRNDKIKESDNEYAATLDEQLSLLVDHSDDMLEQMFKLLDRYFDEEDESNKKELKAKIDQLRDELIEYKLVRDDNKAGFEKYLELKKSKQRPYFIWYLEFAKVFQEKGGFDIVIGNPPYLSYYGRFKVEMSKEEEIYFKKNYDFIVKEKNVIDPKVIKGRFNSIMFFLEKSKKLQRHNGFCTLIIDISIHKKPFEEIRSYLLNKTRIYEIINNLSEFEKVASGQTIINFGNYINKEDYYIRFKEKTVNEEGMLLRKSMLGNSFEMPFSQDEIIGKIDIIKTGTLEDYFGKKLIRTGITFTGQKDKFLEIKDEKNKKSLIEGRKSIKYKYCKPEVTEFINYDKNLLNDLNKEYEKKLDKSKNKKQLWIGLGDELVFRNPKIIITQTGLEITATYSEDELCLNLGLFSVSNENSDGHFSKYNLKYFLGILNSKLITYYALKKNFIFRKKGATPQIRLKEIKQLPIVYDGSKESLVINLVDSILHLTNSNDYLSSDEKVNKVDGYKNELDLLIYKMYKLSDEDINTVENYKVVE